jgi:hypothetical protein
MEKMEMKTHKTYRWMWWLFPVTGLAALAWFLVRVVPKPSRATYPCQRVAAPLAGGFLFWLAGISGIAAAFHKARYFFRRSRYGWAAVFVLFLLTAGIVTLVNMPEETVTAAVSDANSPIGDAKGIHPGRVVWAYDPDATDWDGYSSPEYWWESSHTDITAVENMVSRVIRGVSGETTDAAAWDAIFRYNNRIRGKGDTGYQQGEKITIKANLVTCIARMGYVDTGTYEKDAAYMNNIDTSPQVLLALLRQLVNTAGTAQGDIHVGDPTALIPNHYWNILHGEFPNVKYWDNYGGSGRTRAEFSTVPFYWSTSDANGKLQDYLPEAVAEADYIINLAVLKGHSCGMSLCSKNHFGTLIRCPDGLIRDQGTVDYYNTHLSLPNAAWSPGTGHYRAQVDLMGHPEIGDKTMLYMLDGLYSGYYWDAVPVKWTSAPFGDGGNGDWPSSLFGSLDPVAIDSVGYDFLKAEWPTIISNGAGDSLQGGAEDYLHEAAQADNPPSGTFYDPDNDGTAMSSLGVHEHWNNATSKQYSRNLGTGDGIELFAISNISGTPAEIALNRERLNFAYVKGGDTPPSQSFSVSNTGGGTAAWIVSTDASWLNCTPTSGTDGAKLTVSVNPSGLSVGTYSTTVTVTDLNSGGMSLDLQVYLRIYASGTDAVPIGFFATPDDGSTVSSSIAVTGWALDDVYVESVKIYRGSGSDLVYIGDAMMVEGARPDVETAYPDYPFNYKAGWGYMLLTNFLPNGGNGTFTLHAIAKDSSGHEVTLGTKTITCDNANAVKPFGAIDTPAQGGEAWGGSYRNNGWVLTPMPNSIPTDGSTITVYVDGVSLGHPVYNIYRSDVATLFPGYANSDGAAAYLDIDMTVYDNGIHTIYWTARDSAGNTDGIGSRYFSINNSAQGKVGSADRAKTKVFWGVQGGDFSKKPPWPPEAQLSMGPIKIIKGCETDAEPQTIYPDRNGNVTIKIAELQRFEIRSVYAGYQVVDGRLRRLPIGATMDMEKGIFYWLPGPGFIGSYKFVFITVDDNGLAYKKNVTVSIGSGY